MMNLFYKNRGSVSVFLVIILVPIIVVCSIFIDGSRMKLAQGLAKSSADLTLNTGLSYYDLDLSDYYGLLASSQSQEEFLENAEMFFEACMVSQGIDPSDADGWAATILETVNADEDIVDLLQIEVMENFSVTPVDGANLADAAMIKTGIIDFMKYRAPIELLADGKGIVGKLQQIGEMETVIPVETSLQNEKQEYYEAESELLQLCGDIYIDFNTYDADTGITVAELEEIRTYLDGLEAKYKELYIKMVKDLYNTEDANTFVSMAEIEAISYEYEYYNVSASTLKSEIQDCEKKCNDLATAKTALDSALQNAPARGWDDSYYDIQYWVQMDVAIGEAYRNYVDAYLGLKDAQAQMDASYAGREQWTKSVWVEDDVSGNNVSGGDVSGNTSGHWETESYDAANEDYSDGVPIYNKYSSMQTTCSTAFNGASSQEIKDISAKLASISNDAVNNDRIDSTDVHNELYATAMQINEYYLELKAADELLGLLLEELGAIDTTVAEYEKQYGEWKGEAETSAGILAGADVSSNIVDNDMHEIGVLEGTEDPTPKEQEVLVQVQIDQEKVQLCYNRVNAVKSLLGTYIKVIETKYLYGGQDLMFTTSYTAFKDKSGIIDSSIVINNAQLEAYAEEAFAAVFSAPLESDYHNVTENNNPDFSVNRPEFRDWLDTMFDGKNLEDKTKASGVLDKLKKVIDEKKKEQEKDPATKENSANEIYGKSNLPSVGASENDMANYGSEDNDGVESTTSLIGGRGLTGILETGRDHLLAMSYIYGMFTYDTYVKESKYDLAMEADPNREITLSNYKEVYETQDAAWATETTTFTANKSLTNKLMNASNNYTFCNEIEYIIYGGTNEKNMAASYGTIFGIRYAMNIAPVFGEYWNHTMVTSAAGIISSATAGIIPVPLIKLIICLGMTAAETAMDISYLKAGLPVLFIKTKDDLFLQLDLDDLAEGTTELAGDIIKENNTRKKSDGFKLAYSDYLALFLFIAMLEDEDGVYLRVGDVIQCNMDQHDGTFSGDYLLSNAVTYYQLEADVKVRPLMLALPWSIQNGSDILDGRNWNTFHINEIRGY